MYAMIADCLLKQTDTANRWLHRQLQHSLHVQAQWLSLSVCFAIMICLSTNCQKAGTAFQDMCHAKANSTAMADCNVKLVAFGWVLAKEHTQ